MRCRFHCGLHLMQEVSIAFLLMAWKVAGHYGLDRILLSSMMKRLHHPTGNKASRMWRPIVTPEPRAPALSIDKTHGFELPVDDC